jgi:hypothetical protein
MDNIKHILINLQNGHPIEKSFDTIRNIIQNELMHVATIPTVVTIYGERGHKYIQTVRLYGVQEKMKITPKGGEQVISFYNEDWSTNLSMTGWDNTPGTWFQPQIKHLDNLSGGSFVDLVN